MVKKFDIFKALVRKARQTDDEIDRRYALRYGVENRISTTKIRKYL